MRINFFEEFPTDESLVKARLIDFPSTIYIAAHSLAEYENTCERLIAVNSNLDTAYWPILEQSYWVSPFSYPEELENLSREIAALPAGTEVLLDLELPLIRKKLFFVNLHHFFSNKKRIGRLFVEAKEKGVRIVTAEYPVANKLIQTIIEWMGIAYPQDKYSHEKVVMMYSSMIKNQRILKHIRNFVAERCGEAGNKIYVGLGTIAIGILGNEPTLPPEDLDRDLKFAQDSGAKTVIIFRLGGLDNQYREIIKKYT